jgi:hypothetical protein
LRQKYYSRKTPIDVQRCGNNEITLALPRSQPITYRFACALDRHRLVVGSGVLCFAGDHAPVMIIKNGSMKDNLFYSYYR